MLSGRGNIVTRWEFLHDLDIRDQSRPGKNSLQEIVAQDRVLGNTPMEGGFKHVHIVDTFSAIGSFSEEILIHVGNHERVRIHPTWPGEDALKKRTCTARRQCRSYSRLKHGISFDHAAGWHINLWPVEGVSHLSHQSPGSSARKSCIGIECDHVTNAGRHTRGYKRRTGIGGQEARVGRSPQQSIQLVQFATLAFPPHPLSLTLAPQPSPMKKKEPFAVNRPFMTLIQARDSLNRNAEKAIVSFRTLCWRVAPIREKCKAKIAVLICEIMNF
jgi:hypothetical protein